LNLNLGLDIQGHSMRLMELATSKRGFMIHRAAIHPLSPSIFSEGKIKNWELLAAATRELVLEQGLSGSRVAIALPQHLVRRQRMRVSKGLVQEEVEAEIYVHVQKDLPGLNDALCIDYAELPAIEKGCAELLFTVTREEYVARFVECMVAADLRVKIVDIDIYALQRAVCAEMKELRGEKDVNVILYLTEHHHLLLGFNEREIVFQRDLSPQGMGEIDSYFSLYQHYHINQIAICCSEESTQKYAHIIHQLQRYSLCFPQPFSKMNFSAAVDKNFVLSRAPDFFIACGLAMREMPLW